MVKRKISDFFAKPSTLSENSNEDSVINTRVVSESTFWRAEPSRAFCLASRAEPSFTISKTESKRVFF